MKILKPPSLFLRFGGFMSLKINTENPKRLRGTLNGKQTTSSIGAVFLWEFILKIKKQARCALPARITTGAILPSVVV